MIPKPPSLGEPKEPGEVETQDELTDSEFTRQLIEKPVPLTAERSLEITQALESRFEGDFPPLPKMPARF